MARVGFVGVLSFVALCLIFGLERSEGVVHSVGDSTGWGSPPNSDFYDDWADRRIFRVGDQLSFSWTGTQNVAEVNEQQHDDCVKVTEGVMATSPAVYNLTGVGKRYFITTIGNQCNLGQELEIEILPAVAPTTPPRATSPPPSTGTPVPTPTPASRGTVHIVGDALGWGVPSTSDFYDDWEERQIFRVGDQLVFNWNGTENVVEVTEQQHDDCMKVTGNVMMTSPAVFNLTATGKRYFISTIGNNCNIGQELEIEIHPALAGPTTPSPPAATTPAPPTSTGPPATTHTVGDATGWTLPALTDFYDDWADRQVFMVGDKLSFNWTGNENVVEVNENQHDDCIKVTNGVKTASPAVYELTTIGKRYFISTIGNNCNRGQELEIEVIAAPPSTGTPTTPMASPPSSNPGPSGSPMGPSGSPMGPSGSPMGPSGSTTPGSVPSGSSTSGPGTSTPSASASFGPMAVLSAAMSTLVFAYLG